MSAGEWGFYLVEFFAGIGFLVLGSSGLVEGGNALAHRLRIRPLIIGLTVVAFGTSAPELFVTTMASIRGKGGVALGNVIGSNIANIGLILGLVGIIRTIELKFRELLPQFLWMMLIYLIFVGLLFFGGLGRGAGAILFLSLILYLYYSYRVRLVPEKEKLKSPRYNFFLSLVLLVGGMFILGLGSDWLIKSGVAIARALGVDEIIIGLSMVAIGTSLPELAVSVYAGIRRNTAISVGNIIGSNIFNLSGVLGVALLARPIPFEPKNLLVHLIVMFAFSLILPFLTRDNKIKRWEGAILLSGFLGFMAYLYLQG